jgi:hypothetical protein
MCYASFQGVRFKVSSPPVYFLPHISCDAGNIKKIISVQKVEARRSSHTLKTSNIAS